MKRQITCNCNAYKFPHRLGGGDCEENKVCPHGYYLLGHSDYDPNDTCPDCSDQARRWELIDYYCKR